MSRKVRFKARIARRLLLRFHMSLILMGVLFAGVLANGAFYALGMKAFSFRYALVVLVSYGMFFLLVKIWLEFVRTSRSSEPPYSNGSPLDGVSVIPDLGGVRAGPGPSSPSGFSGGGGRSGGGGASSSWGPSKSSGGGGGKGSSLSLDFGDEGGAAILVLLLFAVLIAVIFGAGAYLIYQAPEILAEILFEVALSTGLIRATRRMDQPGWLGSVFRATWIPFSLVMLVALGFGLVANHFCPTQTRMRDVLEQGCVRELR